MEKAVRERLNRLGLVLMQAFFAAKGTGDVGDSLKLEDGTSTTTGIE